MTDRTTAYVSHSDCSRHDTGWRHPDHQGRLPAIARAVHRDMLTLFDRLLEVEAGHATDDDLGLVHSARHVAAVRARAEEAALAGRTLELDGVPVSGASWEAATAAAGTALAAVDAVLDGRVRNAFCAARPPGRGARADAAGGHSLFNTVAIAARHLRERRGVARVLVVAWGAEPPDALAGLLAPDPGIRLVSVHGRVAGDGSAGTPGFAELPPGAGGEAFAAGLGAALDEGTGDFAPGFVLLSAGFEVLASDPVGTLGVEPDEVHAATRTLRDWADARAAGRLVSVLEGGYDAGATARAVVQHVRALAGLPAA